MRLLLKEKISQENNAVEKLRPARFRFINEQLYTMSGEDAAKLFKEDPQAFKVYHEGYRHQVTSIFQCLVNFILFSFFFSWTFFKLRILKSFLTV